MSKNSRVINVEILDVNERIDAVTRLMESQRPNDTIVVTIPPKEPKIDTPENDAHA